MRSLGTYEQQQPSFSYSSPFLPSFLPPILKPMPKSWDQSNSSPYFLFARLEA